MAAMGACRFAALLVPIVLAVGGCDMANDNANLTGRASEEWTRHYTLSPGGEIQILESNGSVEVEGVDGTAVDVRAERIARAASDAAAAELLKRITITESARADRVSIETEYQMSSVMIGVSLEVQYHVRAPKNSVVNVRTSNGAIAVSDLAGKIVLQSSNGQVSGKALTGGVEVRTSNGGVNIALAAVGEAPISVHTTNGGVSLSLPETAKATISAAWTNGGFDASPGLKIEVSEASPRRFEGRLNGGGTPIEIKTTNGPIRLGK